MHLSTHNGVGHLALTRTTKKNFSWAGAVSLLAPIATPVVMSSVVNRLVGWLSGQKVHFHKIDVHLLGALKISLSDASFRTRASANPGIDARAKTIIFTIKWKDAIRAHAFGDVDIDGASIHIDAAALKTESNEKNAQATKSSTFPLKIGRLTINKSAVSIASLPNQTNVPLNISDIRASIRNIDLNRGTAASSPVVFAMTANVTSSGSAHIQGEAVPFAANPTFSIDADLHEIDVVEINETFGSTLGFNITHGFLDIYSHVSAAAGKVHGYVKPLLSGLAVENGEKLRSKTVAVRSLAFLLRNPSTHKVATRVEFSGDLSDPKINVFGAIKTAIANAFVHALPSGFDPDASAAAIQIRQSQSRLGRIFGWLKESFRRMGTDNVSQLSASLSFYTAFSLAPLLVLVTAIAGFAFGREAVQGQVREQLVGFVGEKSAVAVQSMIEAARRPASGVFATVVSTLALLGGASQVMTELKNALNRMWRAQAPRGFKAMIQNKLFSFGMVLAIGFLLLVSLMLSAVVAAVGKILGGVFPFPEFLLHLLDFAGSLAITTLLFSMIYKFLPDTVVRWSDVWIGSFVTALMFTVGKILIGLYLGRGAIGSMYGAAGSVLIMLLWVYYSAQILYFGAEFTKVHSEIKQV